MKTLNYIITVLFALIIINVNNLFAQNWNYQFQSQLANKYKNKYDSLNNEFTKMCQNSIELRNRENDSLIQKVNNRIEKHLYLADSIVKKVQTRMQETLQTCEQNLTQVRTQISEKVNFQNQLGDSLTNKIMNEYQKELKNLDSLKLKYEYMLANGSPENALNQIMEKINTKCKSLDSMLMIKTKLNLKYIAELDTVLINEQNQIKEALSLNLHKVDSIIGIKSQFKLTVKEKFSNSNIDTVKNKYQKVLSDVIDETIVVENKLMIKFKFKLQDPRTYKHLFRIEVLTLLKSTATNSVEISAIEWSADKADVMSIITSTTIENPEEIALYYDGAVETTSEDKIVLKESSDLTSISKYNENNNVNIFPNPCSSYFMINNIDNIASVSIINLNGLILKQFNNNFNKEFDISELRNGLYIININYKQGNNYITTILKK
jgi:DNA-binding ferritin-like protein